MTYVKFVSRYHFTEGLLYITQGIKEGMEITYDCKCGNTINDFTRSANVLEVYSVCDSCGRTYQIKITEVDQSDSIE